MQHVTEKLTPMADEIDAMCWESRNPDMSDEAQLQLAEALQGVLAGILALAWKHGLSEVSGMNLYGPIARGEMLTAIEIVRQMVNGSMCNEAFADTLRRLADQIEKSPSDCGAGALI